jgi:hypothetical protein
MIALVLLMIHGLLAAALIGAITHQAIALWQRVPAAQDTFFARLRSMRPAAYTNAIVILYVLVFFMGAIIYATYRVDVRPYLENTGLFLAAGAFETKEHLSALGLGLLPAYWLFWKAPTLADKVAARKYLTLLLAFYVWWNFLTGHVVNNIRGLAG